MGIFSSLFSFARGNGGTGKAPKLGESTDAQVALGGKEAGNAADRAGSAAEMGSGGFGGGSTGYGGARGNQPPGSINSAGIVPAASLFSGAQAIGGVGDALGFQPPKPGTYELYRKIEADPTVAVGLGKILNPIVSNTWTWHFREDRPEAQAWMGSLQEHFDKHRPQIVRDSVTGAITRGWFPAEKVWEEASDDSTLLLLRLKPLRVDYTKYVVHKSSGQLKGLANKPPNQSGNGFSQLDETDADATVLPWNKAFAFKLGGEAGDPYGRSRFENIRKDFCEAEQIRGKLAEYIGKISGIIAQIFYPDGTSKMAAGNDVPNQWAAMQLARDIKAGKTIFMLNKFASMLSGEDGQMATPAMMEKALAAAGKSDWLINFLEPGGTDYTAGMIAALEYYDKRFIRGLLQPERAVLEADKGGRADAEQFADTGMLDSEQLDSEFALAFSREVLDDVLVVNWGPAAKGCVWVEAKPLSDAKVASADKAFQAAMGNPLLCLPLARKVDWSKSNVPFLDDEEIEFPDAPKPAAPGGGGSDAGGKGAGGKPDGSDGSGGADKPKPAPKPDKPDAGEGDSTAKMLARWCEGETLEGDTQDLARSDDGDGDGHWITEDHVHLFIRGGKITKGPAGLVGKAPSDLPRRGKLHHHVSPHESSYHAATGGLFGHHEKPEAKVEPAKPEAAKAPAEAPEKPKAKEPHEMTLDEFKRANNVHQESMDEAHNATAPLDHPFFGGKIVKRTPESYTYKNPKGREFKYDVVKTDRTPRGYDKPEISRYVATAPGSDVPLAGVTFNHNLGQVVAMHTHEGKTGLVNHLLGHVQADFGKVEAAQPMSAQGARAVHGFNVAHAVASGKKVSPEVLKDYPRLSAKSVPAESPASESTYYKDHAIDPHAQGVLVTDEHGKESTHGSVAEAKAAIDAKLTVKPDAAESKFSPGDAVILRGADGSVSRVNYRGPVGEKQAAVVGPNGIQFTVDAAALGGETKFDRKKREFAENIKNSMAAARGGKSVVLTHPESNNSWVIAPSAREPGKFQVTEMGADGRPHGHHNEDSLEAAVRDATIYGYRARPPSTRAPFDADASGHSRQQTGVFGQPEFIKDTGAQQGLQFETERKPAQLPASEPIKSSKNAVDPKHTAEMFPAKPKGTLNSVRAPKGGAVSPVDGIHYKGGRAMPIHGQYSGMEKSTPKAEPIPTPTAPSEHEGEGRGRAKSERQPLTPDQIQQEKQRVADRQKWGEVKAGPIGQVKWMGDNPGSTGTSEVTKLDSWMPWAEAQGPEKIGKLITALQAEHDSRVHASVAKSALPMAEHAEAAEWEKAGPKREADHDKTTFPAKARKHEKIVPGSLHARQLVQHLLGDSDAKDKVANYHAVHKLIQSALA